MKPLGTLMIVSGGIRALKGGSDIILRIPDDQWRDQVKQLARIASAIIILPEETEGILEEIELVREEALRRKTIVYMASEVTVHARGLLVDESPRTQRWEELAKRLQVNGIQLPKYTREGMLYLPDETFGVSKMALLHNKEDYTTLGGALVQLLEDMWRDNLYKYDNREFVKKWASPSAPPALMTSVGFLLAALTIVLVPAASLLIPVGSYILILPMLLSTSGILVWREDRNASGGSANLGSYWLFVIISWILAGLSLYFTAELSIFVGVPFAFAAIVYGHLASYGSHIWRNGPRRASITAGGLLIGYLVVAWMLLELFALFFKN